MYKKLKLILITMLSVIILVGCQQITKQEKANTKSTMSYEKLSEREVYITKATGNNLAMYNIKNLPNDKKYKLELFYEEYKNGEKIREDMIMGIHHDEESPKIDNQVLTLNYQEDKITYVFGLDSGHSSGVYPIKEKFENGFTETLDNDINLELGTEIYIYHSSKGINLGDDTYSGNSVSLGVPINKDEIEEVVKKTEGEVLIKLVYKEVK